MYEAFILLNEFYPIGELWTNRVMLYYVWDKPGAWSDPANIQSVVVDPYCGVPFEANAYDINADGKYNYQLLITG